LWRTNETDRAFSQCTECLFQYHMTTPSMPAPNKYDTTKWRRTRFYMLVSRDICLVTLLLQIVIALLGTFVWLCDSDEKDLLAAFCGGGGNENNTTSTTCPDLQAVGVYYLCGFLLLLVLMGVYGSILLCFNECSIQKSIPTFIDPEQGGTITTTTHHHSHDTQTKSARYQNHRQRYHHSSRNSSHAGRCCDGGCYAPVYVGDTSGNDDCCCCIGPHHHHHSGSNPNGDCCRGCGDSCGGDGDCVHILLCVLVVTAVIMAVIGFCVGIIIAVVMCQRVIQTHVYLLHKRQLVQEFTVMDLQEYDVVCLLPQESSSLDTSSSIISPAPFLLPHPPPSAPPMDQEDQMYLQKLGLMEK
jgi:hypothetical protein